MRVAAGQRERVTLVGLDFGSTTSSALVATARVASSCTTGRMELADTEVVYRSEPVFTPLDSERLDLTVLRRLVDGWLGAAGIAAGDVFAGGAIVTGLAARRDNAPALKALVKSMIGDAVVATADDPRLESWLAFMGSAAPLSLGWPQTPILNLDIGGGTANAALGRGGSVCATGCAFIGARHIRFEPGTYRITALSDFGSAMLEEIGITRKPGDMLEAEEAAALAAYLVQGLEAIVAGDPSYFSTPAGRLIEQVPLDAIPGADTVVTFSGGVGELVYRAAGGEALPPLTTFGDLGIDLASAILASPRLSRDLLRAVPENRGRATVHGLTLYSTEVSGTTLFLPETDLLPLSDLPVVASLTGTASEQDLAAAVRLARGSERGACIQISWPDGQPPVLEEIRSCGARLREALAAAGAGPAPPIVLLTTANVGKAIGNYATGWQREGARLIVIDEIPVRNAHFVNVGRPRHGVVPVSFYGIS